jgi:diguanylate cyclase (GGDEF)-like protein
MRSARLPENERERLRELERYRILDTLPEQAYEDLVKIAAGICGTPMALVSLIDHERQWFKARTGIDAPETPRDIAFCAHAINQPDELFIVQDARVDERFSDNPLVTEDPNIRFYAGAPLVTPSGYALGTLCVIDREPRELEPFQIEAMRGLSRQVVALFELRRAHRELRHHVEERNWYEQQLRDYQKDLEQENLHLTRQSGTDALTGVANRHALNAALEWRFERAREGERLHLAIVDIDHFKAINDRHGHQVGDQMLVAVARVLREQCADQATVARAGGEEFMLLLPGVDGTAATAWCERIRAAVATMDAGIAVTVSMGLADYREGDSPNELYVRADRALYAAKSGGRNRVVSAGD